MNNLISIVAIVCREHKLRVFFPLYFYGRHNRTLNKTEWCVVYFVGTI